MNLEGMGFESFQSSFLFQLIFFILFWLLVHKIGRIRSHS